MTVGLVLVSHSRRLAEGLVDLAGELGRGAVPIEVAAGAEDGSLGTDALAIRDAIGRASRGGAGAVVLLDLGSAVLATDAARELLPADLGARVEVADAPLVEGALAAVLEASLGSPVGAVREAAEASREVHKW